MNINADIRLNTDHVYLHCTGTYSLAEAKRVFQRAVDAALESGKSKILIDAIGVEGDIKTAERFEYSVFLAEYIAAHALGKIAKIAIAGREPLIDKDRFGETVAVNRGVNAKVVTSLDEAIEWIGQ